MITLIVAVLVGGGCWAAAYYPGDWGLGWSIFAGVAGFGVFQGVFGFFLQKRVKRDMEKVQQILVSGQKQLQQKMQRWQMRPPGSIQAAQKEIFEDTKVTVRRISPTPPSATSGTRSSSRSRRFACSAPAASTAETSDVINA